MLKFHYFNLNGEGAIVLAYRKLDPVMECMIVRLRKLREKDEHDLLQIVYEPEVQSQLFLNHVLCDRKAPRSRWDETWMGYLYRYVELIPLPELKGIMNDEQYRRYETIWHQLDHKVELTAQETLYCPVDKIWEE